MQALARGVLARCEFRRRLAERRTVEDAALAVIRPWARTAVARLHFLRLRCRLHRALVPLTLTRKLKAACALRCSA